MTTASPVPSSPAQSRANRRSVLFYVLLAAALLSFILTFALLSPILLSLLLILLISLAVNPIVARIRRWTGNRKAAASLLILGVVGLMGLTGWAFVVPMTDSVAAFTEKLPHYWDRLQKPLLKMEQRFESSRKRLQAEVTTEFALEKAAAGEFEAGPSLAQTDEPESESVISGIFQMFQGGAGRFTAVAFNAAQLFIILVTVFFGVIYTLMNPRPIFVALFSLVPVRHHDQLLTIVHRIGDFVPRWAGATLLGMLTIGLLVFLLMWPFFGFMDALVLGLIAGIFAAIPFLGPILSAVPALLLAFGEGGLTPLWVVLVYAGVQALEGNVVVPFVMARGMNIHPLAVILSVLICVAAFGVVGVLVAAPLVAIVSILHEEIYRKRFLPQVTDDDLDQLSRQALREEVNAEK